MDEIIRRILTKLGGMELIEKYLAIWTKASSVQVYTDFGLGGKYDVNIR